MNIITSKSIFIPEQIQNGGASSFNFMTLILIIFLVCACCLLMVAYEFNIEQMITEGVGICACILLTLFLIYIIVDYLLPCDKKGCGVSETQNTLQTSDILQALPLGMREKLNKSEQLYNYANRFSNALKAVK